MARGGINRALVEKARAALLARGQHPSIDAVRVELGNTGSKSTIHRYLKELEEGDASRLDDVALLSEPIKDLIGRLAARLQQEAQEKIDETSERHAEAIADWEARYAQQVDALQAAEQTLAAKQADLETARADIQALRDQSEAQLQEVQSARQLAKEYEVRVEELRQQVSSLEEKHVHAREALAHYRQSAKEQREQTTRQHEHQVQQLQAEIRQLNQTLSIKQSEILSLNQDNGRLVAERSAAQKEFQRAENTIHDLEAKSEAVDVAQEAAIRENHELRDELNALHSHNESEADAHEKLSHEHRSLTEAFTKLEAELSVKNEFIDRLLAPQKRE
ncbi:DNA-binding protein [Haliea atlantica]